MTARRLTKQIVDELVPRDPDYVVWCGKLPGFGCRVRTTGHKSFIVMYRAGGRNATPHKVTIGVYGKITVEQAAKRPERFWRRLNLAKTRAATAANSPKIEKVLCPVHGRPARCPPREIREEFLGREGCCKEFIQSVHDKLSPGSKGKGDVVSSSKGR